MTTLRADLDARREEFDAHFSLAEALENRMMLDSSLGTVSLSVRHINTIKSGLIIHLYNVEEAIMSRALAFLGAALGQVDPRRWTEHSLKEWLRETFVGRTMASTEDGRLAAVFDTSTVLLAQVPPGPQQLKKPTGTWDDKAVATFLQRMNIAVTMPPAMWALIASSPEYGDKTPIQFLADRRNAIAHGRRSFEDGASDLDLGKIRTLADITLDYLGYTVDAIQAHIDNEAHLVPAT